MATLLVGVFIVASALTLWYAGKAWVWYFTLVERALTRRLW